MELSSRKTSKRAIEPVDEWLQNEGYYRKHAPKDPTCLFRAVSEQVYQNQRCHIRVRKECVDFMRKNKKMFEEKISTPFDNYLEQMTCFTEWGGMNEILTMSMLYKRNVVLFHGQKLTRETIIDHGYNDNLFLCFTPPKQYETVYSQEYTGVAGFCQSIVYQTLYKNVFKMNNVDATVHKMLHERNNHLRHDKFFLKGNLEIRNQLTLELLDKIEDTGNSEELQLLTKGITPFPYRVAKALDPNIYRNIDYDIWHEIRREVRNSGYTKFNSTELQAGAKCLVQKIDLKEHDKVNNNFLTTKESWDNNSKAVTKLKRSDPLFYTGHIQEMSKNEGPVVVFIEDLGELMTVPYESLKPYPQKKVKQNNWSITANKKNVIAQNSKWKKPWNSTGRKIKDQISNENTIDKNQVNNSKAISKNTVNKVEWNNETHIDNHPGKLQPENYTYKDFTANTEVDNVRAALESTHLSPVDGGDQTRVDKNSKSPGITEVVDNSPKKQVLTNYNHETNQPNKQHNQRAEKNEIFYLPYSAAAYPPNPRYPGDGEVVNYDMVKNLDVESTDIPYSDPATVRHFFNLGVKYFWTQNMWANGINGQPFGDNSYYVNQPPPDLNVNMINSPVPNGENVHQSNNTGGNIRHINRSSPVRQKDQENIISHTHNPKLGTQKPNFRGSELRNPNSQRDSHQSNVDVNKNRMDYKNPNEHQQGTSNKETQRGNKSNSVAPRFKKNYEGRNRNDHHNNQHYRQQQQQQQDYEARAKKQVDAHTMANQGDMGDMNHLQQQQQQQQPHPGSLQHQQQPQPHQQQPQPPLMQAQTPSLNGSYPYPVPYNQQMPYIPLSPYPPESEGFPGPYFPPPPSFIQVPYLPPTDLPEGSNMGAPPCVSPVYTGLENFPAQYSPVYSQYIYPPPTMYQTNQPPGNAGAASAAPMQENCYPGPYQSQPYFIQYPPPIPPVNSQPAPTH